MDDFTKLAKDAVENFIRHNKKITAPSNLSKQLTSKKSGTFVTIEKGKDRLLRGCIGTFLPTKRNVALEIIENAISAATKDFRFGAIVPNELQNLHYTVYMLREPEQVKDLDSLNPKKYGIIVKANDGRTGLLLPDLKEVNTLEKQLAIASQKAGIDLKNETVTIYRFEVEKHKE